MIVPRPMVLRNCYRRRRLAPGAVARGSLGPAGARLSAGGLPRTRRSRPPPGGRVPFGSTRRRDPGRRRGLHRAADHSAWIAPDSTHYLLHCRRTRACMCNAGRCRAGGTMIQRRTTHPGHANVLPQGPLLTVCDVASLLRVSRATVYNWVNGEKIPYLDPVAWS
jgi:hypothetical protein